MVFEFVCILVIGESDDWISVYMKDFGSERKIINSLYFCMLFLIIVVNFWMVELWNFYNFIGVIFENCYSCLLFGLVLNVVIVIDIKLRVVFIVMFKLWEVLCNFFC